jgi:hypothetical protein
MIIDRCCAATKSIVPTTKDNFREAEIVAFEDEEGFFGKAKLKHRGIQFTFDKGAQFTLELGGHLGIMLSTCLPKAIQSDGRHNISARRSGAVQSKVQVSLFQAELPNIYLVLFIHPRL